MNLEVNLRTYLPRAQSTDLWTTDTMARVIESWGYRIVRAAPTAHSAMVVVCEAVNGDRYCISYNGYVSVESRAGDVPV